MIDCRRNGPSTKILQAFQVPTHETQPRQQSTFVGEKHFRLHADRYRDALESAWSSPSESSETFFRGATLRCLALGLAHVTRFRLGTHLLIVAFFLKILVIGVIGSFVLEAGSLLSRCCQRVARR